MPELPEVETIKRRLATVLPGKTIAGVEVTHNKSFSGDSANIVGTKIVSVTRRAKILTIGLENDLYLIVHLKMTGQLLYVDGQQRLGGGHPTKDWLEQLPGRHTRVIIYFDDDTTLYFNDMRMFGWIKVVTELELKRIYAQLGPDIVDPDLSVDSLADQFSRRSIPIKQALMTNQIVCGVGNIYACDSLHLAQISPFRPAKSLSKQEVATLLKASLAIITKAIQLQGTTFDGMYVTSDGLSGNYQDVVRVYGKENQACEVCQDIILREKIGQRSTFYCPSCQPVLV